VTFGNMTGMSMPEEFVPGMIGPLTGMPVKFVPGIVLLTGMSMPKDFVRIIRSVDIVLAINHSKEKLDYS